MNLITTNPRGTQDVYSEQSRKWQYVEKIAMQVADLYGFEQVRFPTFEHTELFLRGVGDTTDVVQKEMYTFNDKANRSITLRPEGTASTARLVLQNGLYASSLPLKLYYIVPCFRYEKPQAGRLREFHQFGVEMFGSDDSASDALVISLANTLFKKLKITGLSLEINSIGCPQCRKTYTEKLIQYFNYHKDKLCGTCLERLEKNPMRILDCKCPQCQEIAKDSPVNLDYLCDSCKDHFDSTKKALDSMKIEYTVNPRIVRGLDYYTHTVFEFISSNIGAQGTVCGGGRYNGLIETFGGDRLSGLGFAVGLERLIMLMEALDLDFGEKSECDIFIANIGDSAKLAAVKIANELISDDIKAQFDVCQRGLKAQMKYANKINAKYSVVLGDDEVENNMCKVKNMISGEIIECKLDEIAQVIRRN